MSRIRSKKLGEDLSIVFTQQNNVEGSVTFDGTAFTQSHPIYLPNGTAAAPSLAFTNTTVMGMYRSGSNVIGFSTAGSERVTIDAQGDLNVGSYISIGNGGTGQIIGDKKAISESVATALTAAMSGSVFFVNGDSSTGLFTLPAPVAGLHYKWVWTGNNNTATVIKCADTTDTSGDQFIGALLVISADNDTTLVETTDVDTNTLTLDDNVDNAACGIGSWVEVICTEDPSWFIHGVINGNTDADGTGSAMFSDTD